MINLVIWIACFIPALFVELICYASNWFVAFFTRREPRTDVVKRLGKVTTTLDRDYLRDPFYLWQTHDNAVDEWWYGLYNPDHFFKFAQEWTQEDYDNSWWIRYYCRVMWLYRNNAYGWLYKLFSRPKETNPKVYTYGQEDISFWYELKVYPKSFQLEVQIPLKVIPRYITINIGWKAHKQTERLLYANRIIGVRKY